MGGAIRTQTWRRWRAFRRAIKKVGHERAGPTLIPRPALQESLTNATRSYMSAEELSQLRTTLEIAYQSRVPDAAASEARLRHRDRAFDVDNEPPTPLAVDPLKYRHA